MMGTLGQKCFTSGVHFSGMFSGGTQEHKEEVRTQEVRTQEVKTGRKLGHSLGDLRQLESQEGNYMTAP